MSFCEYFVQVVSANYVFQLARVSTSGTYIPRRLIILTDSEEEKKTMFVRIVYAEVDITRYISVRFATLFFNHSCLSFFKIITILLKSFADYG